jgi:hypothetical protein
MSAEQPAPTPEPERRVELPRLQAQVLCERDPCLQGQVEGGLNRDARGGALSSRERAGAGCLAKVGPCRLSCGLLRGTPRLIP